MEDYDVYSKFDVEKHVKKYIHYLEVIITEDGEVMYAVPSHQEIEIKRACEKLHVTRQQLSDMTPKEYYYDWLNWLCMQTGDVSVWTEFYQGKPNQKQIQVLHELKKYGAYEGIVNTR